MLLKRFIFLTLIYALNLHAFTQADINPIAKGGEVAKAIFAGYLIKIAYVLGSRSKITKGQLGMKFAQKLPVIGNFLESKQVSLSIPVLQAFILAYASRCVTDLSFVGLFSGDADILSAKSIYDVDLFKAGGRIFGMTLPVPF